jgi:hypothetical protein
MDRDLDFSLNSIVYVFLGGKISELKMGEVWWKYEEIVMMILRSIVKI